MKKSERELQLKKKVKKVDEKDSSLVRGGGQRLVKVPTYLVRVRCSSTTHQAPVRHADGGMGSGLDQVGPGLGRTGQDGQGPHGPRRESFSAAYLPTSAAVMRWRSP